MNIFVLDKNPYKAAEYMCDKHISKMLIESAQLMCTAFENGVAPYKRTHYNHPCAVWTRASRANYVWLFLHAVELNRQYKKRYNKNVNHKSFEVCVWCVNNINISSLKDMHDDLKDPESFALCVPDQYKVGDVVESYRAYYRLGKPFAKWDKLGNVPEWYNV